MIPVFDFSRIIGWVKTILMVAFVWAAFKALVIAAIGILVPYAIYKSFLIVTEKTMEFVNTNLDGHDLQGSIVQLTGLAGWLGERLQLQACFQIMATFVMIRYALSFFHKNA